MATNWYGANQNFRQGNYYDGAQEYNPDWDPNNPNYGKSFAGIQRFNYNNLNRLPSNLTQDLGASTYRAPPVYPGSLYSPHRGFGEMQFDETVQAPEKKGFLNKILGPVTGGIEWLSEKFKRPEAKQKEFEAYQASMNPQGWGDFGDYRGNIWEGSGGNKINVVDPRTGATVLQNKNFDSMFGSGSVEEMIAKKEAWARRRRAKGKEYLSTDMNAWLDALDKGKGKDIPIGPTTVGDNVSKGGSTYTGPRTYEFDRGAFQRSGGQRASTAAGHTDPGKGSYGPWKAEGGRVGYANGELVEDESMFAATPQGMMEENIEEVQGEPTREQLEVIALEIFRLPLEELNEEQLNVVYQAAMEQEPSEEEVQFAAQGPGEGIASLV